jgi:glyoxylase-like metal-dependent hydrolase (beta-lactamase superfamily II)
MRIADRVEALELVMGLLGAQGSTIYPAFLWDERFGATLVDTGIPGSYSQIEEKVRSLGMKVTDIRRILITHQDVDHIGSASAVVDAGGAEVYAHEADVPYIQGEKKLLKLDAGKFEERIKGLPREQQERVRAVLASPPKVRVDHVLRGGEELPFHGGILVIPTPGHTPGHVSYLVSSFGLLIAGDALVSKEGTLEAPSAVATPDMPRAIASLKNLLGHPVRSVLCYHGGYVAGDVVSRLRSLAGAGTA